jgi:hypothetical protein
MRRKTGVMRNRYGYEKEPRQVFNHLSESLDRIIEQLTPESEPWLNAPQLKKSTKHPNIGSVAGAAITASNAGLYVLMLHIPAIPLENPSLPPSSTMKKTPCKPRKKGLTAPSGTIIPKK